MTDPIDLSVERTAREPDNKNLTVGDVLKLVARDLDDGIFNNPSKCFVVVLDEQPNGNLLPHNYRCGLNRLEELGLLQAAAFECNVSLRNDA